jgi:SAM-dependent methyltransferase
MSDSVERFSNRVENYVKYRPDYPREIIPFLAANCGLTANSVVADVGCGTGISSRMFLENGNRVIGVEPNGAMRDAAVEQLADFPGFSIVDGTSTETTLPDASVDLVTAAQAFHWFEPVSTRPEFARILKPNGYIALIWNIRQLDTTPFLIEYEAFLQRFGNDYNFVRHENITEREISAFFGKEFGLATFPNVQIFDFEGLKGRMLSSSYMPNENSPIYGAMIEELRGLFAKHAESGRIEVFYDTNVYFSQL